MKRIAGGNGSERVMNRAWGVSKILNHDTMIGASHRVLMSTSWERSQATMFVVEARCFWRLQVLTDEHAWQRFWQDCVCWRYGVEYTLNPKWKQRVRICQGCIVSEPTVALQSWCSKNANFLGWFSKNCAWSFACTVPSDAWFSGVLSYLMAFFDCFLSHRWNIVVRLRGLPVSRAGWTRCWCTSRFVVFRWVSLTLRV